MIPIFNLNFTELFNAVLKQQNTNLVVIKDQPLENNQFVNLMVLAVQHGDGEETNDAIVGSKEVYEFIGDVKTLVSTSVVLGSTTHPYGVEVFSDGKVVLNLKKYDTIEDAQNDLTLMVNEAFMSNGKILYKQ